jgi:hypothetical protein
MRGRAFARYATKVDFVLGDIQSLFSKSIQKKSTSVADGYGFFFALKMTWPLHT